MKSRLHQTVQFWLITAGTFLLWNFSLSVAACELATTVKDAAWGGFMEGGNRLSPTSMAMVESSDVLIGIGGGEVARDELITAKRFGKEVRFIPADMNHQKARKKAKKKGLPEPTNFGGAADEVF